MLFARLLAKNTSGRLELLGILLARLGPISVKNALKPSTMVFRSVVIELFTINIEQEEEFLQYCP